MCLKCGKPLHGPSDLIFTCITCRHRRLYFSEARAVGVYDGALREAIHALKFRGRRVLAKPLGALMAETAAVDARLRTAQLIIPVPLHPRRLRERGFNQSGLLASELAGRLNLPLAESLVARRRQTQAQSGLSFDERRANVRDAFIPIGRVNASAVLLVDDVISTGFTVSACARALKLGGAIDVTVIAAAMAVLE